MSSKFRPQFASFSRARADFAGAAVFGEEHDQQEGTFPVVMARSPSAPACLTLLSWELKASDSTAHSVE